MELNVGSTDRMVRLAIGIVAVVVGIYAYASMGSMVLAGVALLVGAIMLVTGAMQTCPLYNIAGINTRE